MHFPRRPRTTTTIGLHARELVELSALVATHSGSVVHSSKRLSQSALHQYYSASRTRMHRWGALVKRAAQFKPQMLAYTPRPRDLSLVPWLEEIFLSEALTRVWAAAASAHDKLHGTDAATTIVRSIALGHSEARLCAMRLLSERTLLEVAEAAALDRLRRRVARWIDLLVAHVQHHAALGASIDVCELAIEPQRARDFTDDLKHQSGTPGGEHTWPLTIASLRGALCQDLAPQSPSAELNHQLATSVVACLSPELFDSTGPFQSLWTLRLSNQAADVQALVDDLLAEECPRKA